MAVTFSKEKQDKIDEMFEFKRKVLSERVRAITNFKSIQWLSDETGLSKRTISQIHTRSCNLTLYTMCIIDVSISHVIPMLPNPNFDTNKL